MVKNELFEPVFLDFFRNGTDIKKYRHTANIQI